MDTRELRGEPTWTARVLAPLVLFALMLTGAFGSGAYWDRLQSQGDPAHGRAILPGSDDKLGRQVMFRIYEDAAATITLLERQSTIDGWRGEQARTLLKELRGR